MNVTIIGGAGYIGSVLVGKLLNDHHHVTVADNLYKGGDGLLQYVNNPFFSFVPCDITKEIEVQKLLQREVSAIILLAGIVGLPECDKSHDLATAVNVNGWKNVVKHKPQGCRLVAASTGSVYGVITDGICTEDSKTNPCSHYGKTKLEGESYVVNAGGVALRFATCAGVSPNMRLNLLPNQLCYEAVVNRCITVFEPDNMRTFIDIRDFCDSLIWATENYNLLKHRIYNVGNELNNWSKRQLAEFIKSRTNCFVTYAETFKDQDARNYVVSYERMKNASFYTRYTMEQTIDSLLKSISLLQLKAKYF
jgi:nucleoside-diphosphate-sugar epimerase